MNRLARKGLLDSLRKINLPTCKHCLVEKIITKPFNKAIRAELSLQLIHSNIYGPINVRVRHGASYFITFINDFT